MPQERDNPFPYPTAADVLAAPGTPAEKTARNVVVRHIPGIPRRAYLLGDSDHAPILKGVRDLTQAALDVLEKVDWNAVSDDAKDAAFKLKGVLTDHGCPDEHVPETL